MGTILTKNQYSLRVHGQHTFSNSNAQFIVQILYTWNIYAHDTCFKFLHVALSYDIFHSN